LQLLDEGILRDIKGREVSFRDAIVIATSNAGADLIRQRIENGQELEQFEQEFTNHLISSGQFRPEFLNRFDEIVLFRPLKPEELKQVIDIMMAGVNKTLANQQITVEIDDELKDWLVVNGNDPRLGARPMRRMIQRVVENTMAKRMLSGEIQPGHVVRLTMADLPAEMINT
jgi:ATP-dependent Clp protease ATP-binding subunit ClpA